MKKLFTLLLVASLTVLCAFALFPREVQAAGNGTCGENLTWNLDGQGTLTISGYGPMENFVYYDDSPTDSSHPWGDLASLITKVVVTDGVTSIGDYAFSKLYALTAVSIPSSVQSIGYAAFNDCISLKNVAISEGVTSIGTFAFCKCAVLSSVSLPSTLTSVGDYAFYYCTSLSTVTYCGSASSWNLIAMGSLNTSLTNATRSYHKWSGSGCSVTCAICQASVNNGSHKLSSGVCTVCKRYGTCGTNATWYYNNKGTLTISGSGSMAYEYYYHSYNDAPWYRYVDAIKNVVIENGITWISHGAFENHVNLESISIPASVTSIGDAAFIGCTKLKSVYITDLAAWCAVDFYDFDSTPLCYAETTLYLNGKAVTDLVIPENVLWINSFAFYSYQKLTSVTIHAAVKEIGERAFAACTNLASIQVAKDNAVYSSDAQGVLYNKSKTTLIQAPGAITNCEIPKGVVQIDKYAFRSCMNLRTVTIPSSVTTVGSYAFNYCHGLRGVYITDLSAWCKIEFGSFSSNPLNYANVLYLNKKVVTDLVVPAGITEIKDFAFFNCKCLNSVSLPKGVTEIGEKAFYNCLNVTSVVVPGSVECVGEDAFYNCAALEIVYFCDGDPVWNKIDIHESNTYLLKAPRDHYWEDYACAYCGLERVDDALVFYGVPGLSFQDYIGMQIMVRNSDVTQFDRVFVIATQEGPDGPVCTRLEGVPFYGVYQVFDQQVLSWSMTEKVTMILCGEKDGVVYRGAAISGSVQSMAMQMIMNYAISDPVRCRVLVDMLNYGAAVQTKFNYNPDNLPNAELGELAAFGTTDVPTFNVSNSITGEATLPVLVNNISLQARVEIQLMFLGDVSAYTPKVTANGEEVNVVFDSTTYPGYTVLRVAIKAAQMRETFQIALYDGEGNPVTQVYQVSVEGYATARQGGEYSDVDIALMRYGDSVKAFARN